ncbi:transthyretin [Coprinopsis marcescibilis]|uniref:5-hydroxyisourate hydrolase n=1 Tax=Coprinopsis marcescibilis TaxID=230819 RepID=A0A5C3LCV4_COPMA|nr:transthyretin [Coprinopsis marcescibilis]
MSKSPITCHVLDASLGKPATGVEARLYRVEATADGARSEQQLAQGLTNSDGRILDLLPPRGSENAIEILSGQNYKIIFSTKPYFDQSGRTSFYPWVEIPFTIQNPEEHYHIPLLISPFSFTTYRGS